MATDTQTAKVLASLKNYKRKYIKKQNSKLDESATRIMINSFLTEVLGYKELDEIKTEYNIRGEYADYVIQLNRKKQFVIEVKSIQFDLNERHLRQSLSYAANEGIDWIILTNGRAFQFYRVIFSKPIDTELLITLDLMEATPKELKSYSDLLVMFTKKSVERNEHELFWKKSKALSADNISKILYSEEAVKLIRKELKKSSEVFFEPAAIKEAIRICLTSEIKDESLKFKTAPKPKKAKTTTIEDKDVVLVDNVTTSATVVDVVSAVNKL